MAAIVLENRSNKTIPDSRFGCDVAWFVRRVAKSVTQLPDCDVQALIEVDKGVLRPKTRVQVRPAYGFPGVFQERLEKLGRLALQLEANATLAQNAAIRFKLERPKNMPHGHGLESTFVWSASIVHTDGPSLEATLFQ
jgi:hypothetical protein